MTDQPREGHIIISGTGRAGTTLLVQFFTSLGMDTGYTRDESLQLVDAISSAGLEARLNDDTDLSTLPHVVKSPWFADHMEAFITQKHMPIEAVIIPMRDIFAAAESRRRVSSAATAASLNAKGQPGALWKTSKPEQQELHLALQFYRLLYPLVVHQVPVHFLHFPFFARDADYMFDTLEPIFVRHGKNRADVEAALRDVIRPELIHDFSDTVATSAVTTTSILRKLFKLR